MSAISITKLYEQLSTKLGKEAAKNLTTFIDSKINHGLENQMNSLATKEDLAKEIARLDNKISESKSETIKWMFIFWIGQVIVTFSFILIFLKQ